MKVLVCTQVDTSGQCIGVQTWTELPTAIPPLSVEDALLIASKIALLWAIAFTLRTIARFIWRG